jgi:beta-lactamase regulating signal transducer with metallopeptidase domain
VTSADQLTPYSYTASGTQALHVKEAPYKALLLWIGVAVVIVAIPSLLYVRSRLMKREKKGPRRERKESKEKESKEEEEL